jgi:cullin-4
MFSALGIYAERFEKSFIEATQEFYSKESEHYLTTSEVAEYLKHVESRLTDESDRVHHYLEATTKKPLIATTETQLIEKHVPAIILKGFDSLMLNNRHDDLRRMYTLFGRVSTLDQACRFCNMLLFGLLICRAAQDSTEQTHQECWAGTYN